MTSAVIAESRRKVLVVFYEPAPQQTITQFAAERVDFSLEPLYETPIHGPFDPDLMPYWEEPANALTDPDVDEVIVKKASRVGGSENIILNPIRYFAARDPQPILYVGAQRETTERYFDERIVLGLKLVQELRRRVDRAKQGRGIIYLPDMFIAATYPGNKSGVKQFGYPLVFLDEASTYPLYSADMYRERTGNYPLGKIVIISSPDPQQKRPSSSDPIFQEYDSGDQRHWMMRDPKTGKRFRFEMGSVQTKHGLKWSPKARRRDGSWDMKAVYESAHYVTPFGTVIKPENQVAVTRSGHWVPTNTKDAVPKRRSYHVHRLMSPFKSGEFGHVARAFIQAKKKGPRFLRVFRYEYEAEPWVYDRESATDDVLKKRCRSYARGQLPSTAVELFNIWEKLEKWRFFANDVQKDHFWWTVREWVEGGHSGGVDFGHCLTWEEMNDAANRYEVHKWFCDNAYEKRKHEVYEAALRYQFVPVVGSPNLKMHWRVQIIDPFEGKAGQGNRNNHVTEITFNSDSNKQLLMDLLRGESEKQWFVFQDPPLQYVQQVNSEERVDGVWQLKKGVTQNHLWDCEGIQLLAARRERIFTHHSDVEQSAEGGEGKT